MCSFFVFFVLFVFALFVDRKKTVEFHH